MSEVRRTSLEAYTQIKESGLLSGRRWQVYDALYHHGPCTASELFYKMRNMRNPSHSNVTTRLGELRDMGVAYEVRERLCSITGRNVIEWDVTERLPVKFEKTKRIKCAHCDGRGYIEETQARFDI